MAPACSPFNLAEKFPAECQADTNGLIQTMNQGTDTKTLKTAEIGREVNHEVVHKMSQNTGLQNDMALSHILCPLCISSAFPSSLPSPYSFCSHWLFNTWRKTEANWLIHNCFSFAGALEEVKTHPSNTL